MKSLLLWIAASACVFHQLTAQEKSHLTMGDPAPQLTAYKWLKGPEVNQFKQGHIYVVEFGATWCAPCIEAIPKLSDIASAYKDKVTVISLFIMEFNKNAVGQPPSYLQKVKQFIEKRGSKIKYSVGVDDPTRTLERTWIEAAGKSGIPHMFLINHDGKIAWIGSNPDVLKNEVDKLLKNPSSITVDKNLTKPFQQISLDNIDTLFASIFSKFTSNQQPYENSPMVTNYRWAPPGSKNEKKQGTIDVRGESLRRLYFMAHADTLFNYPLMINPHVRVYPDTIKFPYQRRSYGKYWYRPLLEITDSSAFESNYRSLPNRFNYYLKIPKNMATAKRLKEIMQQDLKNYFGYHVLVERKLMPCWNLTISDKAKKELLSKNKGPNRIVEDSIGNHLFLNAEVRDIIFQLELAYGYTPEGALIHHPNRQPPFFDATGIEGEIDYQYEKKYVDRIMESYSGGKVFTFDDYKEMLSTQGIELVKSMRLMNVVVIRDPK